MGLMTRWRGEEARIRVVSGWEWRFWRKEGTVVVGSRRRRWSVRRGIVWGWEGLVGESVRLAINGFCNWRGD